MAGLKFNVKLEIPHCDGETVFKIDVDLTDFETVKEIANILAKKGGFSIDWPKKGGGDG